MASTRTRPLVAVAATCAVLLGLAACSSSGSDDATPAKTTTTAKAGAATTTTADAINGGDADVDGKPLARYADYTTTEYDEPSHWVCRPDTTDDICHSDLDSTAVEADGTTKVEKFEAAAAPKIDCFYVYPTISRDKTTFSDWNASPDEEGYVTLNQAARLRQDCRVFAPVYRQRTLAGLAGALGGGTSSAPEEKGDPYADVLDAFRTYMAKDNHGRGFVLIGHSQGAGMLNELIQKEIDPNADVRKELVGAYLAGGAVAVPDGKLVGGDFQHVPLCSKADEAGCVVTWATFRSTATPPANSYFGKVRGGKPGEVAGCVSPAAPSGGTAEAHSYFPANSKASILSSLGTSTGGSSWLGDGSTTKITTPFVSVPGLVSVGCTEKDGFHFEEATVHPDPAGPRADDIPGDITPEWGLHLVDVNLVMGDIVTLVAEQAKAYAG